VTKRDASIQSWWQPLDYAWNSSLTHHRWLSNTNDLPKFESGFLITDEESQEWFVLESYYHFDQPKTTAQDDERESSLPERQIWSQVRSYLVRESDFDRIIRWTAKQDFTGRWMPESHEAGRLFLGEYYWSPAHGFFAQPYYQREGWIPAGSGSRNDLPVSVHVTSDPYGWSKGLDCSIEDSISILLPCGLIAEGLDLTWSGVPGQLTKNSVVVTQDPSVFEDGPAALLIRKEYLLEFLQRNGLRLMWTVLAEKQVFVEDRETWPGRLEISGSYALREEIQGGFSTKLVPGRVVTGGPDKPLKAKVDQD
jgi:hypothetical protein